MVWSTTYTHTHTYMAGVMKIRDQEHQKTRTGGQMEFVVKRKMFAG